MRCSARWPSSPVAWSGWLAPRSPAGRPHPGRLGEEPEAGDGGGPTVTRPILPLIVNPSYRTAAAALLAVAGLAAAGAAAQPVATSVHSRVAFGTWDPSSPPERIDYCGRRYDAGRGRTWTREEAVVGTDPAFHPSWREVGRTDSGTP